MRRIALSILLVLSFTINSAPASVDDQIWLLVDTKKLRLEVKQGDKTIAVLTNIAIGRGGAGFKKHSGDDITPVGSYRIGWINNDSPFYRFYGFDYPSKKDANEALLWGLLSKQKHTAIVNAHKNNEVPPQNTPIGGRIGIHGLGKGDEFIHKKMNWTHGCIALTNEQIDRLGQWIGKGTLVKVK